MNIGAKRAVHPRQAEDALSGFGTIKAAANFLGGKCASSSGLDVTLAQDGLMHLIFSDHFPIGE